MGWLFGWGLAYMPSSVNSVKWMRWHNPLAQNSLRCYVQFVEGVFPSELMPGISRWSTAVCWICAQRNALVFFVIFGQWVKPGPGGRVLTVQGKKSVGAGKLNPPTRRSKWVLTPVSWCRVEMTLEHMTMDPFLGRDLWRMGPESPAIQELLGFLFSS